MSRETTDRRTILARLATGAAVAGIPAAALAGEPADAELLRLGQELEAAWENERATYAAMKDSFSGEADAITTAASEATAEIIERIEELDAHTLAGLRVKARAISWCHSGEEIDLSGFQDTTDRRLASSLINDLLALEAAHG